MNISSKSSIEVVDRFCTVGDMLSVDVSVDAAVTAQIWSGWNKFSQPITFHALLELKRGGVQLLCKSYVKTVNPRVRCKRNKKNLVQDVNKLKIKCKTLWLAVNGED